MTNNNKSTIFFRNASHEDIPAIVALLADDVLGAGRETTTSSNLDPYYQAFDDMEGQKNNTYLLAVDGDDNILGCAQLTLIPGLSRGGMKRAQLEGIRVAKSARGTGIGQKLMDEAKNISSKNGCGLIQLTTDLVREDALRFYEGLGYVHTHKGMKLPL